MPPTNLLLSRAPNNVCNTPDCYAASTFVKQFVNLTVDPCSDFYEYSCSAWINDVKDQNITRSSAADVQSKNVLTLVGIMESSYDDFMSKHLKTNADGFNVVEQADTDRANFQKIKDYYNVCLVPERSVAELYPDIAHIKNTLLAATPNQLGRTLAYFTQQGISSIVNAIIQTNNLDHDHKLSYLDFPTLAVESDQDVELVIAKTLGLHNQTQHVLDASQKSNLQLWSQKEVKAAATTYINVQAELKNVKDSLSTVDFNRTTLDILKASSAVIDWSAYFSDLVDPGYASNPTNQVIYSPDYLLFVDKFFAAFTLKELQDFFVVRFVMDRRFNNMFKVDVSGEFEVDPITNVAPRQLACARQVSKNFFNSVSRFFVLETIGGINEKNNIDQLIKELQTSWLNHLPGTPWLDAPTKARAIEKINALNPRAVMNLINPDWTNPNFIQSYYEHFLVDTASFYKSVRNYFTWNANRKWKNIANKALKVEWSDEGSKSGSTSVVNAFYNPTFNQFELLQGIIQRGFYDAKFPQYLNYGGLGSVIGHELTHALDNLGRLFNSTGYYEDWWTTASVEAFDTRSQCFIEQYNKSSIVNETTGEQIFINGEITLGENIADSGGLTIALLAYREHFKALGQQELALPDFEYLTPEQMFFVGYAISRCEKYNKVLDGFDPKEEHPPASIRTTNSLINSADFAKAFNCPAKSRMNPHKSIEEKCVIW